MSRSAMKGQKGKDKCLSKRDLPGKAKGGGMSGGSMSGGSMSVPKAPGTHNTSKPR